MVQTKVSVKTNAYTKIFDIGRKSINKIIAHEKVTLLFKLLALIPQLLD